MASCRHQARESSISILLIYVTIAIVALGDFSLSGRHLSFCGAPSHLEDTAAHVNIHSLSLMMIGVKVELRFNSQLGGASI